MLLFVLRGGKMKIALVQMESALGEVEKNRRKAKRLVAAAMRERPDAVVLPELWDTGFFPSETARYADEEGRETQAMLCALAKKHAVYIIGGSAATLHEGFVYNTSYIVDRLGRVVSSYQKAHLFSPSGEDKVFRAGGRLCTFSLEGVKAAVAICYDIRFCEFIRLLALQGVSLLFVVAAWPLARIDHWQALLKARAIENQMYVAGVNGAGRTGGLVWGGHSLLVDPWGETKAAADEKEGVVYGTADISLVDEIRRKMDVFGDRRTDLYFLDALTGYKI